MGGDACGQPRPAPGAEWPSPVASVAPCGLTTTERPAGGPVCFHRGRDRLPGPRGGGHCACWACGPLGTLAEVTFAPPRDRGALCNARAKAAAVAGCPANAQRIMSGLMLSAADRRGKEAAPWRERGPRTTWSGRRRGGAGTGRPPREAAQCSASGVDETSRSGWRHGVEGGGSDPRAPGPPLSCSWGPQRVQRFRSTV